MSWILCFFHFVSPRLLPLSNGGTSHLIPTILARRPIRQLRITTPKLSQNATSSLLAWVRFVGLPFLGLLKSSYPSTMTVKTQWFSMATAVILSRMTTPKMACCHSNHLEWAIIFSQVAFWHWKKKSETMFNTSWLTPISLIGTWCLIHSRLRNVWQMQTSIITGYVDSIFYFLSSLSLYFLSYMYIYSRRTNALRGLQKDKRGTGAAKHRAGRKSGNNTI